jgi:hypothetical protein
MLIDSIFGLISNVLVSLFDTLPDYTLPTEITALPTLLATAFAYVGKLGMWFPISTIANMGFALFAAFGVSLAIRIVRLVIGYIPTMGGSQQ